MQSSPIILKDILVSNPIESSLDNEVEEKRLDPNSPNLVIEVNLKREGSRPPSSPMEHERESIPTLISINLLV